MTDYVTKIVNDRLPHLRRSAIRVVDVGAGQGYLTRALHRRFASPTLAIDADGAQTHGSRSRSFSDDITYRTIHITPPTLVRTIDRWVRDTLVPADPNPVLVLVVALHACGSLTPDIFRALLDLPAHHPWIPVAVVVVGCCYNLMRVPEDFPLASRHRSVVPLLPASAFHLAAQIPDQWRHSLPASTLATRKVVWRALLGRLLSQRQLHHLSTSDKSPTGSTPAVRKLGRLSNHVYTSWSAFLAAATRRIDVDLSAVETRDPEGDVILARLENLHVRRCLLGPTVESCIVLDRLVWLQELLAHRLEKHGGADWSVGYTAQMVNLFDQATGSARNIALVLAPT